jgi:3-dehydroquinate dehydratase/shikimate dehydrogenase
VKFTWPTPTLDDAWPLLAAVSQKRILPVVGMGLGRADLTFSLLGRKYGSPWIYAALEQGMEAYSGQETVFELDETYYWRDIDQKTTFIAIAGFGPGQLATTRVLNAAFKQLDLNIRCLPLDVLKVRAIIVSGGLGKQLLPLAEHVDKHDFQSQYLNLLLKRDDGWHGYNTLWRSGLKGLEAALGGDGSKKSLERQNVMILGNGGIAQSMVYAVTQRKGMVSICGPGDEEARQSANLNQCRFVPFQNLYETLVDAIIIADPTLQAGAKHGQINGSLFRSTMTVLDVGSLPQESSLVQEARDRGANVLDARQVYMQQINSQFKAITGKEIPPEAFAHGLGQ